MKAVIIKNMSMPETCADCRLMVDGWCYANGLGAINQDLEFDRRPDFCPLEEIGEDAP